MDEKKKFLKSFEDKLKSKLDKKALENLKNGSISFDDELTSSDYEEFRLEKLSKSINFYEKICNFSEKTLNLRPDEKSREKIDKEIYNAHLNCTSTGVQSASLLFPIIFLIIGMLMIVGVSGTIGFGIVIISVMSYFAMQNIPSLLARRMKSKANDQIIIAIFYIVAFMRFNSNFELAVQFAANYLKEPLSLDFKRLLWELENAKHSNIKNAFDEYLEGWREENLEFLEAIYLIESSLYESEEFRRISLLDKALDTILQGNYEKMLHFAQNLRSKVSTFNMIGIVLPILGLIILPLAASFGDPKSTWEIVFLLYDLILPICVTYFGFVMIFNRPSATNSIRPPKNLKNFDELQKVEIKITKEKSIFVNPKYPAYAIFFTFLFIGLLPFIVNTMGLTDFMNAGFENTFGANSAFGVFQEFKRIDKDLGTPYTYGPYGVYPGILSLFIPLAFACSFGYYLRHKYGKLIHLRDKTKNLEKEFPSATFQLGNRINEGISAELAFGAVAETMKGTEAGNFFLKIDKNIKFNGMSVEAAIFDEEKGAIIEYPSDLVISSMKIFIKSIEKGPEIAAKSLVDLSKYLSEIHSSNERMLDLLSESIGSMKSHYAFLAPVISAVVISIVSLVTMIMGTLSKATAQFQEAGAGDGIKGFLGESIPTYLFQISVGVYIVSLIAILVYIVTNLENGEDKINTWYNVGDKMISAMTKYSVLTIIGIVGFAYVGSKVLGSIV